jgi:NADPH:quinone reductase-like Zn-dependent oxidoreductase
VVEAVGANVTRFKSGDEVFGVCPGGLAEYACGSESKIVMKPENVTFEEAASSPVAAFTALQGLRDHGHIQSGQKVLINGASGGVGTYAVQIAKSFGAEVTAVCRTKNVDLVRSIGADHVIDYTQQDFAETGQRYDLVFDCYWDHSLAASRRALQPNGIYVIVGGPVAKGKMGFMGRVLKARLLSAFSKQKFVMFIAKSDQKDLEITRELMQSGKLKPVIDRRYPLSEVPEAMRYLEEGHARGKIIIDIA